MAGFFEWMLGRVGGKGSGTTAKDRLKFVLVHDRIHIHPEQMREMKAEILTIIKKYVPEVDQESVDIVIEQSDRYKNKLIAEIPFTKQPAKASADNDGNDDLIYISEPTFPDDETVPTHVHNDLDPDDTQ